ncbi:MAG: rhodanese-like domain-containing protein [Actinobacteria bacterium]|nr:rhodanese-like domain-containing protein [Actinomycetota bacterium]
MAELRLVRMATRQQMQAVPRPVEGEPGLVEVDTTWGTIQPMEVAEGVRTVGEVEVIEHLEKGLPVVDSRDRHSYDEATIPGATNLPFADAAARRSELHQEHPTVFFCNGPQCGQSPRAIRALLEAGHPPERIRYYRGGLHDWITLGLPVAPRWVGTAPAVAGDC